MASTVKVLVLGGPDGEQGRFVTSVSKIKVKSSTAAPSGEGTIPMHFGRVRLGIDLDLQIFGAERDQVSQVVDAIRPGLAGVILLFDENDAKDPHFAAQALDELSQLGLKVLVVSTVESSDHNAAHRVLNLPMGSPVLTCAEIDREMVKASLLSLLEAVLQDAQGSAA